MSSPRPPALDALEALQAALVEAHVDPDAARSLPETFTRVLSDLRGASPELDGFADALLAAIAGPGSDPLPAGRERAFQALNRAIRALEAASAGRSAGLAEELAGATSELLAPLPPAPGPAPPSLPGPPGSPAGPTGIDYAEIPGQIVDDFVIEARELLQVFESAVLALARDPGARGRALNAAHTLKGNAGLLGLPALATACHAAEELLGAGRLPHDLAWETAAEEALLRFKDHCAHVATCLERRTEPAPDGDDVTRSCRSLARTTSGTPAAPPGPPPAPGPMTVPPPPAPTDRAAGPAAPPPPSDSLTARVDTRKLDELVDWMGEGIVARLRIEHRVRRLGESLAESPLTGDDRARLARALEDLEAVVASAAHAQRELEDRLMALRMVAIRSVLQRIPRLVRQTARQVGREAEAVLVGEDVELDRTICEALADPFVHLVRNAVAHGIEPPDERRRLGKPAVGTVKVSARSRGDRVRIEIADDGRGIDPALIAARALELGIARAEELAGMDDRAKRLLVFRAGFSTSAAVSEVSGRGVGLDVVRRCVERLEGTLDVESVPGKGTRFVLQFPLTLALVDVLLVEVGDRTLAVPLHVVIETMRLDPATIADLGECPVVPLRGAHVPLVELASILGLDECRDDSGPLPTLVVQLSAVTAAVAVSRILGRQKALLKPLTGLLVGSPLVSGTTILGDGRVVPVLEPAALVAAVQGSGRGAPHAPPPDRTRILVAEDSRPIRNQLVRILTRAGYAATAVEDGAKALEAMHRGGYALLSSDIVMPGIDGYELCRRLRDDPRFERLPIVAMTSQEEKVDRVRGFEAGFDEYLVKPVDEGAYLGAIRRLLEARRGGKA